MRLVPLQEDGTADKKSLNAEFSEKYLGDKSNPRWIAKPTVAYLWARTVTCKNCRALVPLLKTRWLCKKDYKRVLLTMEVRKAAHASMPAQTQAGTPVLPDRATRGGVGQASLPGKDIDNALSISHRHLPHWRLNGSTYFVTWRLRSDQADMTPEERSLVITALRHFDGTRYKLLAYVVMNDHIHVIVEPQTGHDLSWITHSWKSHTAHQLQKKYGRKGSIWQDESFDRIIRDEAEFLEKAGYILNNPLKRWPDTKEYEWVGTSIGRTGVPACHNSTGRDACPTESLDEPTAYYLLHRHDFGLEEAPAGACILYAISCGLSDKELAGTWDLIGFSKGKAGGTSGTSGTGVPAGQDDEEEFLDEPGTEAWPTEDEGSGSHVKLKTWAQRKGRSLGYEAPSGRPIPLIDRVHRLMHLWKAGDVHKADEYIDANGLRRQELFKRLLQSLIELSPHGSEERSLLESLSNHIQAKGGIGQVELPMGTDVEI